MVAGSPVQLVEGLKQLSDVLIHMETSIVKAATEKSKVSPLLFKLASWEKSLMCSLHMHLLTFSDSACTVPEEVPAVGFRQSHQHVPKHHLPGELRGPQGGHQKVSLPNLRSSSTTEITLILNFIYSCDPFLSASLISD